MTLQTLADTHTTIKLLGGGGVQFFNWTIFLFHFLPAELFFHTLQNMYQFVCGHKYYSHFLRLFFSVYKVGSRPLAHNYFGKSVAHVFRPFFLWQF